MRDGSVTYSKNEEGVWLTEDKWPKGLSRCRIQAFKDGYALEPFGDYSITEARIKVVEFVEAEKRKDHGYTKFVILPQESVEMPEETKAKLRERSAENAARRAAMVVAETPEKAARKPEGLKPGEIFATIKGREITAAIDASGNILYEGQSYATPSGAGKAALGGRSVNGWTFWYLKTAEGKVPLASLRG